jgi:hypothetical protein
VVVGGAGAGQVPADEPAMPVRVILVLDARSGTEHRQREARNVAGSEDVVLSCDAAVLVHDDPVVDRQPGCERQLGSRDDTEPGYHEVRHERPIRAGANDAARGMRNRLPGEHLDAPVAVVVADGQRQLAGQNAPRDPRFREDHRDAYAGAGQGRRRLGADEAAAHHDRTGTRLRQFAHVAVVVERPEPDDPFPARQRARPRAGREQESLPRVLRPRLVPRKMRVRVDRDDPAAGHDLYAGSRPAPDLLLGRAMPEGFREWWPLVGRVRLGADDRDRALGVVFANRGGGRVAGHAGTDDQVTGGVHLASLPVA